MDYYYKNDLQSVLLYIREELGYRVFRDPPKLYATIRDLAPELEPEGAVLRQIAEKGLLSELKAAADSADTTLQNRVLMKIRYQVMKITLNNEEKADFFLETLVRLYGLQIPPPNVSKTPEYLDIPPICSPSALNTLKNRISPKTIELSSESAPAKQKKAPSAQPTGAASDTAENDTTSETEEDSGASDTQGGGAAKKSKIPFALIGVIAFAIACLCAFIMWNASLDLFAFMRVRTPYNVWGNIEWSLENGVLTISGNGPMEDVEYSENFYENIPWGDMQNSITSIVIQDGVTHIGDRAFWRCENLTSVTIPDSVTSIGVHAFNGSSKLTKIKIPNSVTTIGRSAFAFSGLKTVVIPDKVTVVEKDVFYGCSNLISVTIPDGVSSIGDNAFVFCNLTNVTLPNSVTNIGESAFQWCSNLTSVKIPDSVTTIGKSAFYGCHSLMEVVIADRISIIEDFTFHDCKSLTSIIIPERVTEIGAHAFENCENLKSVVIPDSVTIIHGFAFDGCSPLESVSVPANTELWYKAFPEWTTVTRREG